MKNKGITLIALVVTIIVLLILAGISISMLSGDNSILSQAGIARDKTQEMQKDEEVKIAVLGSYDSYTNLDIDKLLANLNEIKEITITPTKENGTNTFPVTVKTKSTTYEITSDGKLEEVVIADRTGIAIGSYVNYTPDIESTTIYPHTTLDTYSGSAKNTSDIVQDTLDWQVLRIYEDGSIDLIGSATSQSIYFEGILGYTNGVYLMNDICKTLYRRNGIDTRSVNLDDFEYWLNQSSSGVTARNNYNNGKATYGDQKTYTGNLNKYPPFYKTQIDENNAGTLSTDNSYTANGDLSVTQTYYKISKINNDNFSDGYSALKSERTRYWIGTRYASIDTNMERAYLGLRTVGYESYNSTLSGYDMFGSNGSTYGSRCHGHSFTSSSSFKVYCPNYTNFWY